MKKLILLLFAVGFTIITKSQQHKHLVDSNDLPAHHGSMILGSERIYMYHIADYSPHNYQVILEISKKKYLKDKKEHPEYNTYTVEPELFVLPDMIDNPREFGMKLYRGNFTNEKGGALVKENVRANIIKVIYFKKFDSLEIKPTDTRVILWGNDKEQFAAHYITAKPDFDQVIKIKAEKSLTSNKNTPYLIAIQNGKENIPISVSGNVIGIQYNNGEKASITLQQQLYLQLDYINKYYDINKEKL